MDTTITYKSGAIFEVIADPHVWEDPKEFWIGKKWEIGDKFIIVKYDGPAQFYDARTDSTVTDEAYVISHWGQTLFIGAQFLQEFTKELNENPHQEIRHGDITI